MGVYSVGAPKGARIVCVDSLTGDGTVKTCLGPTWQQCVNDTMRELPDGDYHVQHLTDAVSSFEQFSTGPFQHWAFAHAFSRACGVTLTSELGAALSTGPVQTMGANPPLVQITITGAAPARSP
jgi:hypothetical protein